MIAFGKWKDTGERNAEEAKQNCVVDDIADLKGKVNQILFTLSSMKPDSDATVNTMQQSTPVSLPLRTGDDSSCVAAAGQSSSRLDPESMIVEEDQNFSLLLTNIDRSVTEKNVSLMVSQCLGVCDTECSNVKKISVKMG